MITRHFVRVKLLPTLRAIQDEPRLSEGQGTREGDRSDDKKRALRLDSAFVETPQAQLTDMPVVIRDRRLIETQKCSRPWSSHRSSTLSIAERER